jgi:hypothetical protein
MYIYIYTYNKYKTLANPNASEYISPTNALSEISVLTMYQPAFSKPIAKQKIYIIEL